MKITGYSKEDRTIPPGTCIEEYFFNSVASFALVFIRDQESDILFDSVGKWHQYKYKMDSVSIQDNTGKNNIYSDMIMENDYNRYLINENFKEFGYALNKMTNSFNDGHLILLPFFLIFHNWCTKALQRSLLKEVEKQR